MAKSKRLSVKKETFVCQGGPFNGSKLALSSSDHKTAFFKVGEIWHGRYVGVGMNCHWERR